MFLWLKTLYRKRAVTWPFIFYTIIWTLSTYFYHKTKKEFICYLYTYFEKQRLIESPSYFL
ncbi:hypothetical protein CUN36_13350 [Enterococcus faecium]|nr:hypothetical protein CUN36_13350 [Enterococcus faecium]ROY58449.1 hypothetical protein EGW62_09795 [Enterococcus faecium]ROZ02521.1 hypothetical protein EGW88_09795 [Enterococcus faecium]